MTTEYIVEHKDYIYNDGWYVFRVVQGVPAIKENMIPYKTREEAQKLADLMNESA